MTSTRKAKRFEAKHFIDHAVAYESDDCLLWPFTLSPTGYGQIGRWPERSTVAHRVVCERINGPAPKNKPQAAHWCGNRACVNPRHLYWADQSENERDKLRHGTDNRGPRHPLAKLTRDSVIIIRSIRGARLQDIADDFKISIAQVCTIRKFKNWGWLRKYGS